MQARILVWTLGLLLWAGPGWAAGWTDGFEYADKTAMEAVWPSSCPGSGSAIIGPSSDRAFSGSKSLKLTFRGHQAHDGLPATPGYASCFMDRSIPSATTLYRRFYIYLDNFAVDGTTTKITKEYPGNVYPDFYWVLIFGQPRLAVVAEEIPNGSGGFTTTNFLASGAIPQSQWVCVQTQTTLSSAGGADGILREWVNGTQVMNNTGVRMRPATTTGSPPHSATATLNMVQLYTQDGGTYSGSGTTYTNNLIYIDNYEVSNSAMPPCAAGSPTGDTTPPAVPTGVIVL